MAKTDNLTDFLTGLADKFRAKLGGTALINPQSFESKIDEVYQKGYDDAPKGTNVSDTTATPFDVLAGKYFYLANGTKEEGLIYAENSWTNPTGSVADVPNSKLLKANSIPEGGRVMLDTGAVYTLNVPYSAVANAIGLTGDKIVSGNTVLGVAGTAATGGGSETGLLEASTLQNTGIVISNPVLPKRLLLMMITDGFYDTEKTTTYRFVAGLVDFEVNGATLFGLGSSLNVFTITASDFATVSGNTITFSNPADVDLYFLADKTYFYSVEY